MIFRGLGETDDCTEDSREKTSLLISDKTVPEQRAVHVDCRIGWVVVADSGDVDGVQDWFGS